MPLGTTATLLVNLTNAGMARLVISNVSVLSGSDVRLDQSNVLTTDCSDNARSGNLDTIVPGECAQVAILFSPTAIETVTTKLEITSDDPRSPTTTILITASTAADGGSPADAG